MEKGFLVLTATRENAHAGTRRKQAAHALHRRVGPLCALTCATRGGGGKQGERKRLMGRNELERNKERKKEGLLFRSLWFLSVTLWWPSFASPRVACSKPPFLSALFSQLRLHRIPFVVCCHSARFAGAGTSFP